jgi:hypothetical protein
MERLGCVAPALSPACLLAHFSSARPGRSRSLALAGSALGVELAVTMAQIALDRAHPIERGLREALSETKSLLAGMLDQALT